MNELAAKNLRSSLLATLAFFDMFDYPLTLAEIKRFRYDLSGQGGNDPETHELAAALESRPVSAAGGFYFLDDRPGLVATRQRRYRLAEKKFIRARRMARLAQLLPSVRLIAVCNSLALSNADDGSDIDLFIVCRPGTLWITRLVIAGALHLFGLRPTPERHADRFCLSFFLSENDMDISRLALPGGDVYLLFWIASLVPIYDAGDVMDAFINANSWTRRRLPGIYGPDTAARRTVVARPSRGAWSLPLLRYLEPAARRFQERRFPRDIAALANLDSRVVISSDVLKFHSNDRRSYFQKTFGGRLAALGIR